MVILPVPGSRPTGAFAVSWGRSTYCFDVDTGKEIQKVRQTRAWSRLRSLPITSGWR